MGNTCVESTCTSILHRTTESERGLMVGGIYSYLTIKNKHMYLSFLSNAILPTAYCNTLGFPAPPHPPHHAYTTLPHHILGIFFQFVSRI